MKSSSTLLRGCRNLQKKYCTFKCYLERCYPPLKGLLTLWKTYHIRSKKKNIYMGKRDAPFKRGMLCTSVPCFKVMVRFRGMFALSGECCMGYATTSTKNARNADWWLMRSMLLPLNLSWYYASKSVALQESSMLILAKPSISLYHAGNTAWGQNNISCQSKVLLHTVTSCSCLL